MGKRQDLTLNFAEASQTAEGVFMSEDFTFSMMIDSQLSESQLTGLLLDGLTGASATGGYIEYRENVLKIERNSLHDASKAMLNDDTAWMYYQYCVNVFPQGNTSLAEQKSVASDVLAALAEAGINPEFVSEFEL